MRMKRRTKLVVIASLLIMLLLSSVAMTQSRAADVQTETQHAGLSEVASVSPLQQQARGPTDTTELRAFLDELMADEMEAYHIAGAAVSVVKDGQLFLAKGYGYADLDKGIPVDPERTLFAIGSVTKLFTWTAVMQLVEQGKLDLDADVNSYLDFHIPDTYPEPITLKHLLTHTSGFDNPLFGGLAWDADHQLPVRDWVVSNIPARNRPPGAYTGYANYNAVLAGYIVSRVSGQPYEQYVQEHILDPLGMVHATAQSPMPPDLRAQLTTGYTYVNGILTPFPDYPLQPGGLPSGSVRASATDMARFMIAHLQDGGGNSAADSADAPILKEATLRRMHSTLYRPDERMLGTAYGFFDLSDSGHWVLGHPGYYPPMRSLLLLMPDKYLGVFVAYNGNMGDMTLPHAGFQRAFFDHYFPAPAISPIQPPADFAARAGRFVGSYRTADSSETTVLKIMELLFGAGVEVSDPGDGTLLYTTFGHEKRFVEVEPLYFRQVDGPLSILFYEDDRGRITHLATDLTPYAAAIKLAWYEARGFHVALALTCVLIFLSTLLLVAIRFIRDRRLGTNRKPIPRGARMAQWIIVGISVLNLLFLAGTALWGWPGSELLPILTIYQLVLGLGVLSALMTAGALVYTVLAWKNRYWGITGRAYYTLVTVAAVAFVWFLNTWNLLGWRY